MLFLYSGNFTFYPVFFMAGDRGIVLLGNRVSVVASLEPTDPSRVLFLAAGGTPPLPSRIQNV